MQLGAMGADVIHIERPGTKMSELGRVPPTIAGTSIGYIAWNMNKRGLALDLKSEAGHRRALEVIAESDAFLINMRPGVADRLGLGYEQVSRVNPGIVYCAITGWGSTGPLATKQGADGQAQGYTGFWSVNGEEGAPGEFYRHYTQLDATTGNFAAQAVLMGLAGRRRTGRGTRIDLNMLRAASALQSVNLTSYLATGVVPRPQGSAAFATAPDEAFRCRDSRWVGVSVSSEAEWRAFCAAIGRTELRDDPAYATNALRVEHRRELRKLLEPIFAAMPLPYWLLQFRRYRVPAGWPRSFDEFRHDTHVRQNEYLGEVDTHWGEVTTGGAPWRFSRTPARWWAGAPLPGEHDDEIASDLRLESRATSRREAAG